MPLDEFSAVINEELSMTDLALVRSLSIVNVKSLMLSRKRDQTFSGIVIDARKFERTLNYILEFKTKKKKKIGNFSYFGYTQENTTIV